MSQPQHQHQHQQEEGLIDLKLCLEWFKVDVEKNRSLTHRPLSDSMKYQGSCPVPGCKVWSLLEWYPPRTSRWFAELVDEASDGQDLGGQQPITLAYHVLGHHKEVTRVPMLALKAVETELKCRQPSRKLDYFLSGISNPNTIYRYCIKYLWFHYPDRRHPTFGVVLGDRSNEAAVSFVGKFKKLLNVDFDECRNFWLSAYARYLFGRGMRVLIPIQKEGQTTYIPAVDDRWIDVCVSLLEENKGPGKISLDPGPAMCFYLCTQCKRLECGKTTFDSLIRDGLPRPWAEAAVQILKRFRERKQLAQDIQDLKREDDMDFTLNDFSNKFQEPPTLTGAAQSGESSSGPPLRDQKELGRQRNHNFSRFNQALANLDDIDDASLSDEDSRIANARARAQRGF